jgi:uncharacterized membrane protein YhaH (DUF805 family)
MSVNNMTPVDWAQRPILEKYADFTGRAPRAEYWWYALGLIITAILLSIIEGILGLKGMILGIYGPLTGLLWLATIVPGLAVGTRRLHDTNRSGLWLLLMVPYLATLIMAMRVMAGGNLAAIGTAGLLSLLGLALCLVLLVFMVLPSTPGENRYGPNPYGEGSGAIAAE